MQPIIRQPVLHNYQSGQILQNNKGIKSDYEHKLPVFEASNIKDEERVLSSRKTHSPFAHHPTDPRRNTAHTMSPAPSHNQRDCADKAMPSPLTNRIALPRHSPAGGHPHGTTPEATPRSSSFKLETADAVNSRIGRASVAQDDQSYITDKPSVLNSVALNPTQPLAVDPNEQKHKTFQLQKLLENATPRQLESSVEVSDLIIALMMS